MRCSKQQFDTQKALVDQLVAQTHSDQAAIESAKATLDYTDMVAPLTGLTGIRQVDEGNIVHATDTTGIVVITQIKPIAVLFSLPQQELPDLNKGMVKGALPVQAMGADGTSVADTGKVVVINNQVDQTTGTVQLKAELSQYGHSALARAVHQCAGSHQHAAPGRGRADRGGPARAGRYLRLCRQGRQHGCHAPRHDASSRMTSRP